MKNKKKSPSAEETSADSSSEGQRTGILKTAPKKESKKHQHKKKHRVQFDESLNKFFEADYVILVRDEEYDDEYGRCECGNRFCYEGCFYDDEDNEEFEHAVDSPRFDFAAAFAPPIEFVDPVTLSPPDGYKDGCCPHSVPKILTSAPTPTCVDNKDASQDTRIESREILKNENIADEKSKYRNHSTGEDSCYVAKKDTRSQDYPLPQENDFNTPSPGQQSVYAGSAPPSDVVNASSQPRYIVETITMTTVTERRIVQDPANDQIKMTANYENGIVRGGQLWRNPESSSSGGTVSYIKDATKSSLATVEDEKRVGVKFLDNEFSDENCDKNEHYEKGEFTLTFKLGNRVVPCNSLKPNSAVRQLFPDPRFVNPPTRESEIECEENLGKCEGKYLVTEESLRAFNEVNKRSVFATFSGKEKYPFKDGRLALNSDDEDIAQNDLVKKTIERNTLRRRLVRKTRDETRKRGVKKNTEVSLEERIKRLTCDIDDDQAASTAEKTLESRAARRTSPPGEESGDQTSTPFATTKIAEKSAYKKFADLFRNKGDGGEQQIVYPCYQPVYQTVQPDLGIDMRIQNNASTVLVSAKKNHGPSTTEARKQFLSSLAPLTACVTGHAETNYGNRETLKLKLPGDRHSLVSTASTGTEYSLGDIDDVLSKPAPQPDVVAGTPSHDELAMFVQQDARRTERIRKRYSGSGQSGTVNATACDDDNDEHDDYGFSRRPSVRGIKPRFGSTTEILQQIQAQLQPPLMSSPAKAGSHMTWPYYSAEAVDAATAPKNAAVMSPRNALHALKEENTSNEYHTAKVVWEKGLPPQPPQRGVTLHQSALKVDASAYNNIRMFRLAPAGAIGEVAVPYDDATAAAGACRIAASNIFQMKVSPVSAGQMRLPMNAAVAAAVSATSESGAQFTTHPIPMSTTSVIRVGHGQQQTFRVPCPVSGPVQVHLLATHHYESPPPQIRTSQPIHFPPQIVVAKGTQTSSISTTSFYQLQTNAAAEATAAAASAGTYPGSGVGSCATATTEQAKLVKVNYSRPVPHQSMAVGISSLNSSPTRVKGTIQNHLAERGIPEGAVSSSPAFARDCVKPQSSESTNTSGSNSKSADATMIYGMKV